jgi:hypothetical protein
LVLGQPDLAFANRSVTAAFAHPFLRCGFQVRRDIEPDHGPLTDSCGFTRKLGLPPY